MFSTLKYDHNDTDNKLVDVVHSNRPHFTSRSQHSACRACHAKKVKCSGQKSGCDRCRSKAIGCEYAAPKRQQKNPNNAPTSTKSTPALTAASSPSLNEVDFSAPPTQYTFDSGATTPGPDLLQTPQTPLDYELEAAKDMHSVEMPLYFSENATFDELWNTYANGTDSTMEDGGDFIMRGGTSPANGCVDSMFQPLLSLNIAGLQDLMDSSQDPSAMFDDFSTEPTSLESSNMGSFATATDINDWSSPFSNKIPQETYNPSSTPSTSGLVETSSPSPQSFEPLDSPSPNTSHSKTPDTPTSPSCACMQKALRVLEVLETDNNKFHPSAFDHILALKKDAISQCSLMLACEACSATSAFVMLLVVICEKILVSFEKWSSRYQGRKTSSASSSSSSTSSSSSSSSTSARCASNNKPHHDTNTTNPRVDSKGKVKKFFLGVYEVDSEHEQSSLLRSLAMVQLRHLHRLLLRLEGFAVDRKWCAHQTSLASFVVRLEEAAGGLMANESTQAM